MFDTTFSYVSDTVLTVPVSDDVVIQTLHDFDIVIHMNPECKGYQIVSKAPDTTTEYKVEDSLAFIPKRLWSGGVWYTAIYKIVDDGCDITVKAPGGFTSVNKWRLLKLADGQRKIQITSDAKCSKTFAVFVKGFLSGSHSTQQKAFQEKLEDISSKTSGRPGVLRRTSSWPNMRS